MKKAVIKPKLTEVYSLNNSFDIDTEHKDNERIQIINKTGSDLVPNLKINIRLNRRINDIIAAWGLLIKLNSHS